MGKLVYFGGILERLPTVELGTSRVEIGNIRPVEINVEMRRAYLDYAMSVIVQRALPDVRDGLKPVQRRILYGMHDMGLRANGRFRKSAGTVGEVLKSYHPHSETAVYDALVRMVQEFSLRYPLASTARVTLARSMATARRPCATPKRSSLPSPKR